MNDEFPKDPRVLAATRALNLGHSAIDIKANLIRIGCDDFQASTAIEQAIAGIEKRKAAAKKETRTWGPMGAGVWLRHTGIGDLCKRWRRIAEWADWTTGTRLCSRWRG